MNNLETYSIDKQAVEKYLLAKTDNLMGQLIQPSLFRDLVDSEELSKFNPLEVSYYFLSVGPKNHLL